MTLRRRAFGAGLVAVFVATSGVARAQTGGPTALSTGALLQSVDRALPLIERSRQDVEAARGTLRQALGGFDLSVSASARSVQGFYDNERLMTGLDQPLGPLGMHVYGGYRLGRGLFAPYDTAAQTLALGELTAGVEIPLLRNRAIDIRRADRQAAALGVDVAERSLDTTRLSVYRDALAAYWDWAASGAARGIAEALLDLALTRDGQLADSVALGQIAAVERTDNRRAILQRQSALVAADRQLEMRAIDVSLYNRSPEGIPVRPDATRLPDLPRPDDRAVPDEQALIEIAGRRRPELQALRLKRQQQEVQLQLVDNGVQPLFNVFSEVSRDFGPGAPARVPAIFQGGLQFALPLQNRRATGRRVEVRARLSGLTEELRWAEDQVRAEVQDALSALRAAAAQLSVISEELEVARELETLERDRFALGDSTQFLVNLRELATADAALREIRALADYQKAIVTVEAATGELVDRAGQP